MHKSINEDPTKKALNITPKGHQCAPKTLHRGKKTAWWTQCSLHLGHGGFSAGLLRFIKRVLRQNKLYCLNYIFWVVMRCGFKSIQLGCEIFAKQIRIGKGTHVIVWGFPNVLPQNMQCDAWVDCILCSYNSDFLMSTFAGKCQGLHSQTVEFRVKSTDQHQNYSSFYSPCSCWRRRRCKMSYWEKEWLQLTFESDANDDDYTYRGANTFWCWCWCWCRQATCLPLWWWWWWW